MNDDRDTKRGNEKGKEEGRDGSSSELSVGRGTDGKGGRGGMRKVGR